MTMFKIAVRFPDFPCTASRSRIRISLYNFFCMALIPVNKIVSCFGGRLDSTSFLSRRSMNGLKILWSWEINLFFSSLSSMSRLNHSSNCSALAKTSGTKKFNNAHNSWREFWSGVLRRTDGNETGKLERDNRNYSQGWRVAKENDVPS